MKLKTKKHRKGFSLVELLVVIAVIGVIAAIALPTMDGITERGRNSKNRRNAQSLVLTYNSARASGVNVSPVVLGGTASAMAQNITAYFTTPRNGNGVRSNSWFSVAMTPDEAAACSAYISYDPTSGMMIYTAGGDGIATTS